MIRPIFNYWPTVVLSQFVNATEPAHGGCDMSAGCESKGFIMGELLLNEQGKLKGKKERENYLLVVNMIMIHQYILFYAIFL